MGELYTEDWGWVVPIDNPAFGSLDRCRQLRIASDGFLCFIEPHTEDVRKFFKKIPARERIDALQRNVDAVLRAHAGIRDVKWSTHEEFNR